MRALLMPGKRMHVCGPTGTVVSSLRRTCVLQIVDCRLHQTRAAPTARLHQGHARCTSAAGQGHPCLQVRKHWARAIPVAMLVPRVGEVQPCAPGQARPTCPLRRVPHPPLVGLRPHGRQRDAPPHGLGVNRHALAPEVGQGIPGERRKEVLVSSCPWQTQRHATKTHTQISLGEHMHGYVAKV